ncbi:hypothetical protein [Thiothrix unzii]|jgi:hypothetical protein|uniref:hypothetical protein n=1 Tax=Thiothrix unzii TaxID=111769 RepID=UPI002A36CF4A|nr:hypothetical protein [Thiothrix unzii]MDX9989705.1 hypothetical protein [Thiothrix unzii]
MAYITDNLIVKPFLNHIYNPVKDLISGFRSSKDKTQTNDFTLILITTSNKIEGNIHFKEDGSYESDVSLDNVKNLINESRYFLLENENMNIIAEAEAQVRPEKPDFTLDNNFIIKITGQGTIDIGNYPTKSWLRDNITSDNCQVEKVLRLLDGNIFEKFVLTI